MWFVLISISGCVSNMISENMRKIYGCRSTTKFSLKYSMKQKFGSFLGNKQNFFNDSISTDEVLTHFIKPCNRNMERLLNSVRSKCQYNDTGASTKCSKWNGLGCSLLVFDNRVAAPIEMCLCLFLLALLQASYNISGGWSGRIVFVLT